MSEKTSARKKDNQIITLIIMAYNETHYALEKFMKNIAIRAGLEPAT